MALTPGVKLGSYEVLSLLGAGGMGEVYRARDTRLGREVAIKVLPAERMADENRRRRFVQEARAASALNHPNIVTIHEIESADGIDFIVMEHVPGRSLDALIPRQGMRVTEALRIAIPMADALARAHARGIVHRDLKPANVMVSNEGVVKVLDFGLAKLVSSKEEASDEHETVTRETAASPLSHPGTVAGTAGYMSPEQATAGKVDARSDVFSFGAVLYEMVTGRRAFAGNSTAETLAAVVREQPKAPSAVVPTVPKDLEKLVLRCLQKDPDRRFHNMSDVRVELQEIKEESDSQPAAAAVPARVSRRSWLAAGLATVALVTAAAWLRWRPRESTLLPPRLVPLTSMSGKEQEPTFSPDGEQIAFAWQGEKQDNWDVYLKMIGSPEIRRLTTDPARDCCPQWSPDGRQIAFKRFLPEGPRIHLVSPLGGSDRKLSDGPVAENSHLAWSPDGRWVAATLARSALETDAGGIYLVPVQGGEARPLTTPSPAATGVDKLPAFSPDGRFLAYVARSSPSSKTGHVEVVELGADLVPKDTHRRLTAGSWFSGLAWTRDGKAIVYGDLRLHTLWRIAIAGDQPPERIELAGLGAGTPATVASRNRLAFVRLRSHTDVHRVDVGRPPEPVLTSSFRDDGPTFSPDGRRIAFESDRSGDSNEIWLANADGSNTVQLTRGPGVDQGSPRWSPDGRRLTFASQGEDGRWSIWTIDVDGGSPLRLTQGPGDGNRPSWSRDGRFVYFSSIRSGSPDIWRIPATGGLEERVTHDGGAAAYESPDGRTLFLKRGLGRSPIVALPFAGGPERQVIDCAVSWQYGFTVGAGGIYHWGCPDSPGALSLHVVDPLTGRSRILAKLEGADGDLAVSPDGKTFLYAKQVGEGSDLMMIENFR